MSKYLKYEADSDCCSRKLHIKTLLFSIMLIILFYSSRVVGPNLYIFVLTLFVEIWENNAERGHLNTEKKAEISGMISHHRKPVFNLAVLFFSNTVVLRKIYVGILSMKTSCAQSIT